MIGYHVFMVVVEVVGILILWHFSEVLETQHDALAALAAAEKVLREEERVSALAAAAAQSKRELAARAQLLDAIRLQARELARASAALDDGSASVAAAAQQMSGSIEELARTAQTTEEIAEQVGVKVADASEVIRLLAVTSGQIMSASELIQSIAGQTNLLALNASMEFARVRDWARFRSDCH